MRETLTIAAQGQTVAGARSNAERLAREVLAEERDWIADVVDYSTFHRCPSGSTAVRCVMQLSRLVTVGPG